MNRYKIIIGILFSIFLVGCDATYNVNIDGNTVSENVEFIETDPSTYDKTLFPHTDITYRSTVDENANWPTGAFYTQKGNPYEPVKMDNVEYYNQSLVNTNGLGIKYDYTFNLDNYSDSNAVKSCFKNFAFANGEEKISLYANNALYCFNGRKMLDKVTVNLTTTYPVISHNADKYDKSNKTYTWNVDIKNAEHKIIKMDMSKDLDYKPPKEKVIKNEDSSIVILIVFGIVALIGGVFALVLYYKNKKVNNI